MKIAVLVYGRLGYQSINYENTMNAIGKTHDIDIFMSSDNPPREFLNTFLDLYKPISYIASEINYKIGLEQELEQYRHRGHHGVVINNMIRHFINNKRVFSLLEDHIKKTGKVYDVVISLRQDLWFNNSFNFDNIGENILCVPLGSDYDALNDQIAYGNIEVMKKYLNIFDNIITLLEDDPNLFPGPERLVQANVKFHKLELVRTNLEHRLVQY